MAVTATLSRVDTVGKVASNVRRQSQSKRYRLFARGGRSRWRRRDQSAGRPLDGREPNGNVSVVKPVMLGTPFGKVVLQPGVSFNSKEKVMGLDVYGLYACFIVKDRGANTYTSCRDLVRPLQASGSLSWAKPAAN